MTINFIYQAAPADVTQACTEWAAFRYQAKDRGNKRSIVTETHLQTTFDTRAMPDTVKDVIEQYMRRGMMGT